MTLATRLKHAIHRWAHHADERTTPVPTGDEEALPSQLEKDEQRADWEGMAPHKAQHH